jgi:uncharacterized protein
MSNIAVVGRWLLLPLLLAVGVARAEQVDKMPAPTGYVNDYAGVIDDSSKDQLTALCTALDQQAHAQVAIVTIHSLEGDTAADFTNRLEEKWKVGAKGTDRGLIMLFAINDHQRWIEVGYGLEGVLNDAKVGDIGRSMVPQLQQGQYGPAIYGGLSQIADDIAADAHVTLTAPVYKEPVQYRTSAHHSGLGTLLRIGFFLFILLVIFGANRGGSGRGGGGGSGLGWFLLGNFLGSSGGSRGGWGGGDGGGFSGGDGGGFGGFGGGSSGGGGAGGGW